MNFEDPMIRRRVIQLMVTVSTSALHKKADLMLKILEHVCLLTLLAPPFVCMGDG